MTDADLIIDDGLTAVVKKPPIIGEPAETRIFTQGFLEQLSFKT